MNIRIGGLCIGPIQLSMILLAVVLTLGVSFAAYESAGIHAGFWPLWIKWEIKALTVVLVYGVISHFVIGIIERFRHNA